MQTVNNMIDTSKTIGPSNAATSFSITRDEMIALHERRRSELMQLSKEELIDMLIGKKSDVGLTIGG